MTRLLLPILAFAVTFTIAAIGPPTESKPIAKPADFRPSPAAIPPASKAAAPNSFSEKRRPSVDDILAMPAGKSELELSAILWQMPASDIALLWQRLVADASTLPSINILRVIVTAWAAKDPAGTFSAVLASPLMAGFRSDLSIVVLRRWSMDNPQAALAAISAMPPGAHNHQELLVAAYSGWALSAPDEAFDAMLQLPAQDRIGVLRRTVWSLASEDPECLLTRLANLPSSDERDLLVATSLQAVARMANPEFTIRWIKENPDLLAGEFVEGWKDHLLSGAANSLEGAQIQAAWDTYGSPSEAAVPVQLALIRGEARKNPEAAFERLTKLGKADDAKMFAAAIEGWASQDPAAAAEYVSRRAGGRAPEETLAAIVNNWADDDPYATAEWLSSLPASPGRNKAAANFVEVAWQADPANVLSWASLISDVSWRNIVTTSVLRRWSAVNRAAATQWVQSPQGSSYPPEVIDVVRAKK